MGLKSDLEKKIIKKTHKPIILSVRYKVSSNMDDLVGGGCSARKGLGGVCFGPVPW